MSRLLAVSLNGQSRVEHDKEVAELKQRIHDLQLEGEKAVERERELIQKLDAITSS